jgi:hypothetical protein
MIALVMVLAAGIPINHNRNSTESRLTSYLTPDNVWA